MKIKKKKFIFFLIFILITGFQIRKTITNIQTSDLYFINCDKNLSTEFIDELRDYINKNLTNLMPNDFFNKIKNQYPIIKTLELKRKNTFNINH